MRRITLRLFISIVTFAVGICAATAWFFRANLPSSPLVVVSQERVSSPMIMEVSTYSGGMYCYVGDLLNLRVYANGYAEYEVLPLESPCELGSKTKPTKKSVELTADELNAIVVLSKQPDLLAAKKEYAAFTFGTDVYRDTTITLVHEGREKKIVVHNPAPLDPQAESNYPLSLTRLFQTVRQIRERLKE